MPHNYFKWRQSWLQPPVRLQEPSGRSRGSGVVEFTTAAAAKEAIELQQGTVGLLAL